MANNLKRLRLAFLITQSELANRLGVNPQSLYEIEASDQTPPIDWVDALAAALRVSPTAITDPSTDIDAVVAETQKKRNRQHPICRVGARFAVQAMVAKLGGLKYALDLDEDSLATAVQSIAAYIEDGGEEIDGEERLNRLSRSLRIAVLTILQSRGVDPEPHFQEILAIATDGATALLQSFSQIDRVRYEPEVQ